VGELKDNLERVRERIARSAERAGRRPDEILLVAVSKTVPAARVEEAIRAGVTVLGENRVQEAKAKIAEVGLPVSWHMIGHLQTNKAKAAAGLFSMIHSVDGVELARTIDRACGERGIRMDVTVQVNVSGEESKTGLEPGALRSVLESMAGLAGLRVRGLMTIPPFDPDPETAQPHFARLRELARRAAGWELPGIGLSELSMGMTDDFEVAIEEGSTMVRIGRAIFGERR